jgi:acetyl esterase/lipase
MLIALRFVALFTLMLSALTLIKPKTGWGRLVGFIPKLFVGSMISVIGILGLFLTDVWLLSFGLITTLVSSRHIYGIVKQSLRVGQSIARVQPLQAGEAQQRMLSYPWRVRWTENPDKTLFEQDVVIANLKETSAVLLADLWQPAYPNCRSGLGIIYLHGSGWHYADKDFGTRHFFRHLAQQGHVIADLAYALAPQADLFGMVADVQRAIVWMKEHAPNLGIRSDRIILMGGSAGGHLALLAGYTPNHPRFDFRT